MKHNIRNSGILKEKVSKEIDGTDNKQFVSEPDDNDEFLPKSESSDNFQVRNFTKTEKGEGNNIKWKINKDRQC